MSKVFSVKVPNGMGWTKITYDPHIDSMLIEFEPPVMYALVKKYLEEQGRKAWIVGFATNFFAAIPMVASISIASCTKAPSEGVVIDAEAVDEQKILPPFIESDEDQD